MTHRKQKPRIEKIVENYFQVDEEDLKQTTKKEVKPLPDKQEFKIFIERPEKSLLSKNEILKGSLEKKYHKIDRKSLEII